MNRPSAVETSYEAQSGLETQESEIVAAVDHAGTESAIVDEDRVETWPLGPEHVAALGFSSDQAAALNDIVAGECTPLHAARLLRPVVQDLGLLPPFAQPPDSVNVRHLSGCLLLCKEAFKSVDDGVVTPNHAVVVGYRARGDDDLQVRAIQILADRKTSGFGAVADSVVLQAKEIVDENFQPEEVIEEIVVEALQAVEDAIEERNTASKRDLAATTWKRQRWSKYIVCSLITYRDRTQICRIKDERDLRHLRAYDSKNEEVLDDLPETTLLSALQNDKLRATINGKEVDSTYWDEKEQVDFNARFRREDSLKVWLELSQTSMPDDIESTASAAIPIVPRHEVVVAEVSQAEDVLKPSPLEPSAGTVVLPRKGQGRTPKKTNAAVTRLKDMLRQKTMTFPEFLDLPEIKRAEILLVRSRPTVKEAIKKLLQDPEFECLKAFL